MYTFVSGPDPGAAAWVLPKTAGEFWGIDKKLEAVWDASEAPDPSGGGASHITGTLGGKFVIWKWDKLGYYSTKWLFLVSKRPKPYWAATNTEPKYQPRNMLSLSWYTEGAFPIETNC